MSLLTNLRDVLLSTIAFRYLQKVSRENSRQYPQMAVLSFDFIGHHINVYGRYERDQLDSLARVIRSLGRRQVALDVGANIGNHSLFFSELFAAVHAFEPNPAILPLLQYNARDRANVVIHAFGASSKDAVLQAAIPSTNVGGGHITAAAPDQAEKTAEFRVRTLDSVPELTQSGSVDLIKLDVEGHEARAIEGMASVIDRFGPLIVLEQNVEEVQDGSTAALDRLRGLGYKHFYEFRAGSSRVPRSLPKLLRAPLRLIELALAGGTDAMVMEPVATFQTRRYSMILASRSAITAPTNGPAGPISDPAIPAAPAEFQRSAENPQRQQ